MKIVKDGGKQNITLMRDPNCTPFPLVVTTRDYRIEVDHQGETRKLTQFPKPMMHFLNSTKYPHPHSQQIKHNTLNERRTNIPHGDTGLSAPIH